MTITAQKEATHPTDMLWRYAPYYALVIAVFLAYSNVYENAFLYDDDYLIVQNRFLRSFAQLGAIFSSYVNAGALRPGHFYRPVQNVLYLLTYQIAGPSTFAFHFLNVTLHAFNACLVYSLGRALRYSHFPSFVAALFWALHPVQTEAVSYMSGTADLLFGATALGTARILLPSFSPQRMAGAAGILIVGLASKETCVVVPALALLMVCSEGTSRQDFKRYVRCWPLFAVTAVYVVARLILMPFGVQGVLQQDPTSRAYATDVFVRAETCLATLPHYVGLILWPRDLRMDRAFPAYFSPWFWEVEVGAALCLFASATIVFAKESRGKALCFGFVWFAVALGPVTGIFMPVNALFYEHWLYVPTSGLFLGVAQAASGERWPPRSRAISLRAQRYPKILTASALILATALGVRTYEQNAVWHNAFSFYQNALASGENAPRLRSNLGLAYLSDGNYDEARRQFNLAMQPSDQLPEPHQGLAALLSLNLDGKTHAAEEIEELKRAIAIQPKFLAAYQSLADVYASLGDRANADRYQAEANRLKDEYVGTVEDPK